MFEAELLALREEYMALGEAWGTYLIAGSEGHVWTVDSNYYWRMVEGTLLVDWVAELLAGTATHLGP